MARRTIDIERQLEHGSARMKHLEPGMFPLPPCKPLARPKCKSCASSDVFPLPVQTLADRLEWTSWRGPYKCRVCHKKFYVRVKKLFESEAVNP